jgi:RND superfamily putative drug exporter
MQTLARFVIEKRWYVIAGWIVFIIGAQAIAAGAGGSSFKDVFTLPHTETQKVLDLLKANGQNGQNGQQGTIVVHAKSGTLSPTTPPAGLQPALQKLCTSGYHVSTIAAPWFIASCEPQQAAPGRPAIGANGDRTLLSKDGTTALVNIGWEGNENDLGNFTGVYDDIKKFNSSTLQVEFTGTAFSNLAARQQGKVPPDLFGFIAALIILGLVFRTVGAALLPLLSAAAALGSGLALISLLSHAMNVATFATQLAQLMVIGVGVDYALFIVTRHRRNLLRGMPVAESIALAVNTSGRAVLFAGATVCVAILGLCALGVSFLYGVAVGTSIAVLLTMIASLTLMPAVLSLMGYRVLPRRTRRALKNGTYVDRSRGTRWAWWANVVAKNKLALGLVAALVIVVLAIPFFSMRLGHADASTDPSGTTTRKGYDLVTSAFGKGYNSTLELVVDGPGAQDQAYLSSVRQQLGGVKHVDAATVQVQPLATNLAFVTFKTTTSPQEASTTALVKDLRRHLVPQIEKGTSNQVYVFGQTAVFVDFSKVLASKMGYFFAAVIGLSFLLLMVAFRSLVIPATAAVMNLFAAGASFGVVVAIFQWGWGSETLGIGAGGPIDAFLPVLFFAILFGLSMDYQVFLVSRMHEEWVHTGDNARAIKTGQAETGGIITSAAILLAVVIGAFGTSGIVFMKMLGVGMLVALLVDATIVRALLVPATMKLLGSWNWWAPGPMRRWWERYGFREEGPALPGTAVEPSRAGA